MKKTALLLLPLCLSALCACGESEDPSGKYFASLGDSMLSASKNTSFRAYSDTVKLNAALSYEEEGKKKEGSIRLDPLAFDLRIDNMLEGSVRKTKLSLFGKNNKLTKIILGGDFTSGTQTSVEVAPRLYVDTGVIYSDLTDAGAIRLMINTYLADYLKSPFPTKGKLVTGLPPELAFDIPDFEKDPFVSKLSECYDIAKTAFAFSEDEGVSTVSFASTDKAQLELILEALRGQKEDEMVSAFHSARDAFYLTSFDFAVSYTEIGPTGFDFKAGVSFKEGTFADFEPIGEWALSGKINFAYGEYVRAKTVADPDSYSVIDLSIQIDS